MNILVLNYEYPPLGGGGGAVCRELSEEMARMGHCVTVVTMWYPGLPEKENAGGVEIYRLKCFRKRQYACQPREQYSYIISAKRFLRQYLKSHPIDVCHVHFVIPTGPVALWAKRRFGIPYVVTAHGSDVEGHNRKPWIRAAHIVLRPFWKKIVHDAYAVVAPSPYLLHLMNQHGRIANSTVIPNGLNLEKFRSNPADKEDRILLMGRMQKSKNFHTVLTAVSMVPEEEWGSWQVDILGDGPCRHMLERQAITLRTADRLNFYGWVDHEKDEQIRYLKRASVYISASLFENCPMGVLEAIASGCHPLLSDIEGHRQLLGKSEEYFFFPAEDAQALAETLEEILKKKQMGKEYLPDIQKYELKNVTSQYLSLLRNAADGCLPKTDHRNKAQRA